MKFEATTIKDIAKALGLSTSTVSRALRDSYQISPETKKLVLDFAAKNHYSPNPIALSLKEGRSHSIGVIVCEVANSFFSQVINGIESIAYDNGYNVIIAQTHESYDRELLNLRYLASRSIDGLLISVSTETKDFTHLTNFEEKGFPIVFFDRLSNDFHSHKVAVDNFKGTFMAVEHLISCGFRRIGHLANSEYLSNTKERMAGYKEALLSNGIPFRESYVQHCFHGGMDYDEVERALDKLMNQERKPNAVFASADKLTTACLRYFKTKGLRVPEDIALAGFSNSELSDLLYPPLTVVRQPAFKMGEIATELLISQIESKKPVERFKTVVLDPELVIRDSSGKKTSPSNA